MSTNFLSKLLATVFLLLRASLMHAEGSCPPGMYPSNPGSTSGVNGCNPIPGYGSRQQAQPPSRSQWADSWGAIAADAPKGILGVATDRSSKQQAVQAALSDCTAKGGGQACVIHATYSNKCAAVVVGSGGFNTPSAGTAVEAVEVGMKTCRDAGSTGCHTYYSACSLPVRTR